MREYTEAKGRRNEYCIGKHTEAEGRKVEHSAQKGQVGRDLS